MKFLTKNNISYGLLTIVFIGMAFGGARYIFQDRKSPEAIMKLYLAARDKGDTETLRKVIYFPPETTQEDIQKQLQLTITSDSEKMVAMIALSRIIVEYGRRIDDNTAEVGIAIKGYLPFSRRIPFQQIIFVKDGADWKYHYSKFELTEEQLEEMIKQNPADADAYYLLGKKYQSFNPVKASQYYKKYLELSPKGFWAENNLFRLIKEYENLEEIEKKSARALLACPPQSPNRFIAYLSLAKMFADSGDVDKSKMYLEKGEAVYKLFNKPRDPDSIEFQKGKTEVELQIKQLCEKKPSRQKNRE